MEPPPGLTKPDRTGDGTSKAEDSSSDRLERAQRAHRMYSLGDYEQALNVLQGLVGDEEDFRLSHNIGLTDTARGKFRGMRQLSSTLSGIRQRVQSSATDAADDASSSAQNAGGASDGVAQSRCLMETDSDMAVLLYNLAALHFHQKRYPAAREILEQLFTHIEPLEEAVAIHVCFLLLDVLLHLARGNLYSGNDRECLGSQARMVLDHLEKPNSFNQSGTAGGGTPAAVSSPGGSGGGAGGSPGVAVVGEGKDDGGGDGDSAHTGGRRSQEQIEFEFRLHLYKAKVFLLQQNKKDSKNEIKAALAIFQRELRPQDGQSAGSGVGGQAPLAASSGADAAQQLSTDMSLLPPQHPSHQNATALFLKANLEFLRENYRKALKLLASCKKEECALDDHEALYLNNMGCLYFRLRRYHMATAYFARALRSCGHEGDGGGEIDRSASGQFTAAAGRVSPNSAAEILYNSGLQLLLSGKPALAFRCFRDSAVLFHDRPRVWLRMAECSIQEFVRKGGEAGADKNGLVRAVVGSGEHVRVLLSTGSRADEGAAAGEAKAEEKASSRQSGAAASVAEAKSAAGASDADGMSLARASQYLHNAVYLSSKPYSTTHRIGANRASAATSGAAVPGATADGGGGKGGAAEPSSSSKTAEEGSGGEEQDRKQQIDDEAMEAALLALCWVHLNLGDPVTVVRFAHQLLALPSCSQERGFVAHLYAAEALAELDRFDEAMESLAPGGAPIAHEAGAAAFASPALPSQHGASAQARCALHVNIAKVHLLKGNVQAAEQSVLAAAQAYPSSPDAVRTHAYILLRQGNQRAALQLLKDRRVKKR